jgi:uncharacterized membrane protein
MNVVGAYVLTPVFFAVIDTVLLGVSGDRLYRPLILAKNFRGPLGSRLAIAASSPAGRRPS